MNRIEYERRWRAKHPDKVREKRRRQKQKDPAKYLKYFRDRSARLPSRYHGFTYTEVLARLAKQGGGCGICAITTPGNARWHGDHDHVTGKFRGVLCGRCNMGLGLFRDDPKLLVAARRYLKRC